MDAAKEAAVAAEIETEKRVAWYAQAAIDAAANAKEHAEQEMVEKQEAAAKEEREAALARTAAVMQRAAAESEEACEGMSWETGGGHNGEKSDRGMGVDGERTRDEGPGAGAGVGFKGKGFLSARNGNREDGAASQSGFAQRSAATGSAGSSMMDVDSSVQAMIRTSSDGTARGNGVTTTDDEIHHDGPSSVPAQNGKSAESHPAHGHESNDGVHSHEPDCPTDANSSTCSKKRRRSNRSSLGLDLPNTPPPNANGRASRVASLKGKGRAFPSGPSAGGLLHDDDDAYLSITDLSRPRAGLDHGQMSDAAFDRMLANMEADRGNDHDDSRGGGGGSGGGGSGSKGGGGGTGGERGGDPNFPPPGYFDSYEVYEWRFPRPGHGQVVQAGEGGIGAAGSLAAGAAASRGNGRRRNRQDKSARRDIEVCISAWFVFMPLTTVSRRKMIGTWIRSFHNFLTPAASAYSTSRVFLVDLSSWNSAPIAKKLCTTVQQQTVYVRQLFLAVSEDALCYGILFKKYTPESVTKSHKIGRIFL